MKTVKVEGFIERNLLGNNNSSYVNWNFSTQDRSREPDKYLKAELIIHLPEKKMEISESRLQEALNNAIPKGENYFNREDIFEKLKASLFGKDK